MLHLLEQHPMAKAGMDIAAITAILGWWFDLYAHHIGIVATTLSAVWYGYQIYRKYTDKK